MAGTRYHCLWMMTSLLLAGCAVPSPEAPATDLGRLGFQPKAPEVDISRYDAPQQAGAFRLKGKLEVPDHDQVVFRYGLPGASDRRLDISLYPLPPGWHDLSAERIATGHYGQVRQAFADRASHRPNTVLRAMQERLRRNVAGDYTVAEGVLLEERGGGARLIVLEITALPEVFVKVTASAPEVDGQEQLEDTRTALTRFLEHQKKTTGSKQPAEQEG